MATGGAPDDTFVCSVCLEPYTGRSPKLLPCFHTFCLPCLIDLEKHHSQVSSDKKACEEDEGDKKLTLTFPCPTCRTVITVPSGGVAQFQTNFYLNHETLTCDVCDKGQEAMYSCADCNQNMCAQCQWCHDKFTSNHRMRTLSSSYQQPPQNSLDPDWERKHNEQVRVLEAALFHMREEEESLQRHRQTVADAISRRADTLRGLVSQAEERGQKALAEVVDLLSGQIHEDIVGARGKLSRLWQGGTKKQRGDAQTTLLTDDDFQHYQQRNSRGRQLTLSLHQFDDSAINMQAVEAYVGTVCKGTQPSEVTSSASMISLGSAEAKPAETAKGDMYVTPPQSDVVQLEYEMTEMKRKLKALEEFVDGWSTTSTNVADGHKTQNEIFEKNLMIVRENLSALEKNKLKSMDEVTEFLMGNMFSLQEDLTTMRQELKSVLGLNSKVQMDIKKIQQETRKFQECTNRYDTQFSNLGRDLATLKEKCGMQVAFYATLKKDACFPSRRRIILEDVIINSRQTYNPRNGIFTAPVSGIYLFLANALRCEGRGRASLLICSDSLRSGYSQSHEGSEELGVNCVSFLVCPLNARTKVWVEAWSNTDLLSECTSFCGMLIQAEL